MCVRPPMFSDLSPRCTLPILIPYSGAWIMFCKNRWSMAGEEPKALIMPF